MWKILPLFLVISVWNADVIDASGCAYTGSSGFKLFLPHEKHCNYFYALRKCPDGLYFNTKTETCDFAKNTDCKPTESTPSDGPRVDSEVDIDDDDCPTATPCPPNNPINQTLYLPHLTDCKLFCRCNSGVAILHKCATDLVFNPNRGACDIPSNYNCISSTNPDTNPMPPTDKGPGELSICPAVGQCPKGEPVGRNVFLPHESICSSYCECLHGVPRLRRCDQGLHFNAVTKRCENPSQARCQGDCAKLVNTNGTVWQPASCVREMSRFGDVCKIYCYTGYELVGSASITCTRSGWNGTGGINILPKCKVPEEVGIDVVTQITAVTTGAHADFLFILDKSGSLNREQFKNQLSFVQAVVSAFPLSQNRSAGVMTFNGRTFVDMPLKYTDTCQFINAVKKIRYTGGNTDILTALHTAVKEIRKNSVHRKAIVFLVTDGKSQKDPTSAAKTLKGDGNILFTIGLGPYERSQLEPISSIGTDGAPLFYGITSFTVFNKIAEYLNTVHGYGAKLKCV